MSNQTGANPMCLPNMCLPNIMHNLPNLGTSEDPYGDYHLLNQNSSFLKTEEGDKHILPCSANQPPCDEAPHTGPFLISSSK